MKERQKTIRSHDRDIADLPCNSVMECGACGLEQKNRAFCYFCQAFPKNPQCVQCGRIKCQSTSGDCLVKHPTTHAVGIGFVGAICDYCEGWVCHSKKCIVAHSCPCPLEDAVCFECERSTFNCGGRFFKCSTCDVWLCGEDQFEHQASCQVLDAENYKCVSCNRMGQYCCLKCKVSFCDSHSTGKGRPVLIDGLPCKKCGALLRDVSSLSLSIKTTEFGRIDEHKWDDH